MPSTEPTPTETPEALHPGRTGYPVSTLENMGPMLPIGVPTGTPPELEKGFAFRAFRMKEEREIDKIRSKKKGSGSHPGKVVQDVMAYMLTDWGGDAEFGHKSEKHRKAAIRNAYMADVLYAYVWLRIEALGSILGMKVECPACDHEWKWQTDLHGLEVEVVDRFADLADKTYALQRPIPFGDKSYDTLTVGPPTWATVCDVKPSARRGGIGDIKARMIQSCVRGVSASKDKKSQPLALGSAILDELVKRDVEGVSKLINEDFPSVDLSMHIECPNCSHSWLHRVQWNWDFFFSSSSLP